MLHDLQVSTSLSDCLLHYVLPNYAHQCADQDTYQRGGIYPIQTPAVLGNEPSGEVVQLGSGVDPAKLGYNVGDKVAVSCSQPSLCFRAS